jgi:hypothetical protein
MMGILSGAARLMVDVRQTGAGPVFDTAPITADGQPGD